LTKRPAFVYHLPGRAKWGASGALYLQSATAGLNSLLRVMTSRYGWFKRRWGLGPARREAANLVRSGRKQP